MNELLASFDQYAQEFSTVFVPLFSVMNSLPVLPVVISAVDELPEAARKPTLRRAFFTILTGGAAMLSVGGAFLSWLGVGLDDFRIAGGIILLVFAVHDLLFSRVERKQKAVDVDHDLFHDALTGSAAPANDEDDDIGIVPLGIPILFGPASMTALVVFSQTSRLEIVWAAFLANASINGILLWRAGPIARWLGRPLIRAMGTVMGVMLAALAVAMLRTGLHNIIQGG